MSRIPLFKGLLMIMNGESLPVKRASLSKEDAYEKLKNITGQDFGYDIELWKEWLRKNSRKLNRQRNERNN